MPPMPDHAAAQAGVSPSAVAARSSRNLRWDINMVRAKAGLRSNMAVPRRIAQKARRARRSGGASGAEAAADVDAAPSGRGVEVMRPCHSGGRFALCHRPISVCRCGSGCNSCSSCRRTAGSSTTPSSSRRPSRRPRRYCCARRCASCTTWRRARPRRRQRSASRSSKRCRPPP